MKDLFLMRFRDLRKINTFRKINVKDEVEAKEVIKREDGLLALVYDKNYKDYYLVGRIKSVEDDLHKYNLIRDKKDTMSLEYDDLLGLAIPFS